MQANKDRAMALPRGVLAGLDVLKLDASCGFRGYRIRHRVFVVNPFRDAVLDESSERLVERGV